MAVTLDQAAVVRQVGAFLALSVAGVAAFFYLYASPAAGRDGAAADEARRPAGRHPQEPGHRAAAARSSAPRSPSSRRGSRPEERAAGGEGRGRPAAPDADAGDAVEPDDPGFQAGAVRRSSSSSTPSGRSTSSSTAPITTSGCSSTGSASSRASSTSAASPSRPRTSRSRTRRSPRSASATTFVLLETSRRRRPGRPGRLPAPARRPRRWREVCGEHELDRHARPVIRRRCPCPGCDAAERGSPGGASRGAPRSAPAGRSGPADAPTTYSYRPEGRRDPFVSLVNRGSDRRRGSAARGARGIFAGELGDQGHPVRATAATWRSCRGPTRSSRTSCTPTIGWRTASIKAITADSLLILQEVNDPLSLMKQREIRKALRVVEEVK